MFYHQLRNELWKVFGKKRTYIGFGTFLIVQVAVLTLSNWPKYAQRVLEGNGYLAAEYMSALTVALILLIPQILFLMPLYVCLVGGDMVAKEAEDGTLRMVLSRPISRLRLLALKWSAGFIFSFLLVLSLGVMALFFARLWFPWKGMFVMFPPEGVFSVFDSGDGLKLYTYSQLFLSFNAATMMTLAFMFSCFNVKPAAATVLAISFLFLNVVLENIPSMQDYREFMLVYHFRAWVAIYGQPIQWSRIAESLSVLAGFNLTCFIIGATAFQLRDIKS